MPAPLARCRDCGAYAAPLTLDPGGPLAAHYVSGTRHPARLCRPPSGGAGLDPRTLAGGPAVVADPD